MKESRCREEHEVVWISKKAGGGKGWEAVNFLLTEVFLIVWFGENQWL